MINVLKSEIKLSTLTSIKFGGTAKYFASFNNIYELRELLNFAKNENQKIVILGGGSNVIFPDEGFDGLVLKNNIKELNYEINSNSNEVIFKAGAGENWDSYVKFCCEEGFQGIECLSGIPGSTGATPIQNVGAYGQEVADTIVNVQALRIEDNSIVNFNKHECGFAYRSSIFKKEQKDRYIITEVTFRLKLNSPPELKYKELKDEVENDEKYKKLTDNTEKLNFAREKVIQIRKRKSMVIDENDENSVSCGSFFMNPVLSESEYKIFSDKIKDFQNQPRVFSSESGIKIPAAWLIENAGFKKGFSKNGAAISTNHSLALVNKGSTTENLLDLAKDIEEKVFEVFGVQLHKEPVVIMNNE